MRAPWRRSLATAVSFTLLAQSAWPAADSSVWSDRRSRVPVSNGPSASLSTPTAQRRPIGPLAAALPLHAIGGLDRPGGAPWLSSSSSNDARPAVPPGRDLDALIGALSAAPVIVSERWSPAAGERRPPILLVKDIHLNAEAQRNIGGALEALIDSGRVQRIGVEGAFGPFDFSAFKGVDPAKARAAAANVVDKNLAAAPVAVGVSHAASLPPTTGLDDAALYEANVEAYLAAEPVRAAAKAAVAAVRTRLTDRTSKEFSPAVALFDRKRADRAAGRATLADELDALAALVPLDDPDLAAYREAAALERRIHFDRVRTERQAALDVIARRAPREKLNRFLATSLDYRSGRLDSAAFNREFRDLCRAARVDLSAAPALTAYLRYVEVGETIDAERLGAAVDRAEQRVLASPAIGPGDRALLALSDQLGRIGRLVDFSLSPIEWQRYKADGRDLAAVAAALGGAVGEASASVSLQPFEDFYRFADRRSDAMTRALAADRDDTQAAILGGFHVDAVCDRLRAARIPYVVVTPKLARADVAGASAYLSVFSREKPALERLVSGEKLFVSPASRYAPFSQVPANPGPALERELVAAGRTAAALAQAAGAAYRPAAPREDAPPATAPVDEAAARARIESAFRSFTAASFSGNWNHLLILLNVVGGGKPGSDVTLGANDLSLLDAFESLLRDAPGDFQLTVSARVGRREIVRRTVAMPEELRDVRERFASEPGASVTVELVNRAAYRRAVGAVPAAWRSRWRLDPEDAASGDGEAQAGILLGYDWRDARDFWRRNNASTPRLVRFALRLLGVTYQSHLSTWISWPWNVGSGRATRARLTAGERRVALALADATASSDLAPFRELAAIAQLFRATDVTLPAPRPARRASNPPSASGISWTDQSPPLEDAVADVRRRLALPVGAPGWVRVAATPEEAARFERDWVAPETGATDQEIVLGAVRYRATAAALAKARAWLRPPAGEAGEFERSGLFVLDDRPGEDGRLAIVDFRPEASYAYDPRSTNVDVEDARQGSAPVHGGLFSGDIENALWPPDPANALPAVPRERQVRVHSHPDWSAYPRSPSPVDQRNARNRAGAVYGVAADAFFFYDGRSVAEPGAMNVPGEAVGRTVDLSPEVVAAWRVLNDPSEEDALHLEDPATGRRWWAKAVRSPRFEQWGYRWARALGVHAPDMAVLPAAPVLAAAASNDALLRALALHGVTPQEAERPDRAVSLVISEDIRSPAFVARARASGRPGLEEILVFAAATGHRDLDLKSNYARVGEPGARTHLMFDLEDGDYTGTGFPDGDHWDLPPYFAALNIDDLDVSRLTAAVARAQALDPDALAADALSFGFPAADVSAEGLRARLAEVPARLATALRGQIPFATRRVNLDAVTVRMSLGDAGFQMALYDFFAELYGASWVGTNLPGVPTFFQLIGYQPIYAPRGRPSYTVAQRRAFAARFNPRLAADLRAATALLRETRRRLRGRLSVASLEELDRLTAAMDAAADDVNDVVGEPGNVRDRIEGLANALAPSAAEPSPSAPAAVPEEPIGAEVTLEPSALAGWKVVHTEDSVFALEDPATGARWFAKVTQDPQDERMGETWARLAGVHSPNIATLPSAAVLAAVPGNADLVREIRNRGGDDAADVAKKVRPHVLLLTEDVHAPAFRDRALATGRSGFEEILAFLAAAEPLDVAPWNNYVRVGDDARHAHGLFDLEQGNFAGQPEFEDDDFYFQPYFVALNLDEIHADRLNRVISRLASADAAQVAAAAQEAGVEPGRISEAGIAARLAHLRARVAHALRASAPYTPLPIPADALANQVAGDASLGMYPAPVSLLFRLFRRETVEPPLDNVPTLYQLIGLSVDGRPMRGEPFTAAERRAFAERFNSRLGEDFRSAAATARAVRAALAGRVGADELSEIDRIADALDRAAADMPAPQPGDNRDRLDRLADGLLAAQPAEPGPLLLNPSTRHPIALALAESAAVSIATIATVWPLAIFLWRLIASASDSPAALPMEVIALSVLSAAAWSPSEAWVRLHPIVDRWRGVPVRRPLAPLRASAAAFLGISAGAVSLVLAVAARVAPDALTRVSGAGALVAAGVVAAALVSAVHGAVHALSNQAIERRRAVRTLERVVRALADDRAGALLDQAVGAPARVTDAGDLIFRQADDLDRLARFLDDNGFWNQAERAVGGVRLTPAQQALLVTFLAGLGRPAATSDAITQQLGNRERVFTFASEPDTAATVLAVARAGRSGPVTVLTGTGAAGLRRIFSSADITRRLGVISVIPAPSLFPNGRLNPDALDRYGVRPEDSVLIAPKELELVDGWSSRRVSPALRALVAARVNFEDLLPVGLTGIRTMALRVRRMLEDA